MTVDMSKVVPLTELVGEDAGETKELDALVRRAGEFISSFDWCAGVKELYSGIAVPGVIGIFLVRIIPGRADVDEQLWVIVGDVPPAYLVTDEASNPAEALVLYVDLMREWVNAVNEGRPVTELMPVNAAPTKEAAAMLDSRLRFLSERVLPEYADEA
ncbi:MAG TPA: hypothetical protein VHB25_19265 [Gemmatimonadaceae bacterium]|nr:hypothetical protein [Gemmatimonadaceae bacterium]